MSIIGKYISDDRKLELDINATSSSNLTFQGAIHLKPEPGMTLSYNIINGFWLTIAPNKIYIDLAARRMDSDRPITFIDGKCFAGVIKNNEATLIGGSAKTSKDKEDIFYNFEKINLTKK